MHLWQDRRQATAGMANSRGCECETVTPDCQSMSMMRVVVVGKTEDYRKGLAGQNGRVPIFMPSSPRHV
jgi:hypothetical protein